MIRLAVFDIAGTTLYDGDGVNRAFREAMLSQGITVDPERVKLVMGLPKMLAIRELLFEQSIQLEDPRVHDIHSVFVEKMLHYYRHDPEVRPIEGTETVFTELKQAGLTIALNSGFTRDIVEAILTRLGWQHSGLIDTSICSDEVARGRPFPDMIQTLQERCDVADPQEIAKIGDTQADLEEGAQARCRFNIGVTTGSYTREQLLAFPHTHIVDSVRDVPAIILAS